MSRAHGKTEKSHIGDFSSQGQEMVDHTCSCIPLGKTWSQGHAQFQRDLGYKTTMCQGRKRNIFIESLFVFILL
jgi:hypothetical protein